MFTTLTTLLSNRILLADGTNVVEPELVPNLLLCGVPITKIQVTESNRDVIEYNKRADILLEEFTNASVEINTDWLIPFEYLQLDLTEYFNNKLKDIPKNKLDIAETRVANELVEVRNRNFENGLRTIIYVVDTFKQHNQLWGVGRGSSCASYLLYLIGLHCVDPLKYNIHYSEFFHD